MKDMIEVPHIVHFFVNHIIHGDAEIGCVPPRYRDLVIQILAGGVKMKPEVAK